MAPPHKYLIWLCRNRPFKNFYTYTCQRCQTPVADECPPLTEKWLAAQGVPKRYYDWDAELDDKQRATGPALTWDDVLDLHLALPTWGVAS